VQSHLKWNSTAQVRDVHQLRFQAFIMTYSSVIFLPDTDKTPAAALSALHCTCKHGDVHQ
jgi:hypothetical protein